MKIAKIHPYDLEEFAAYICGLDYDSLEGDISGQIDTVLWEKFETDLKLLGQLMEVIMPLIDVGKSPLTNTKFKGFSKKEGNVGIWILKTEA